MNVLARLQEPKLGAIVFLNRIEHDRARGHIYAHGERLGGEQHLDQAHLKQQLDDLFHDRQYATVVNANAARQRLAQMGDLRYVLVVVAESGERLSYEHVHFALFGVRVEIETREERDVVVAAFARERECHHW